MARKPKTKARRGKARAAPRRAKRARSVDAPVRRAPNDGFPIVGVGASAGGLEALTQFFKALPANTGMGFVVVQHLDPKHDSMLSAILSRATSMSVCEVRDEPAVEPNHVYVIPPGRNMVISDGHLRLWPRDDLRGPHRPVDSFLQSLAEERGRRAIGVILSGTGSDGTFGLQAIKAQGGLSFAQDRTAEHDAMPQNAIRAGCVDLVLPPWQIAEELAHVGRHPFVVRSDDPGDGLEPGSVSKILIVLNDATGVDFSHYKSTTLYRRIARRMLLHKLESLDDYYKLLKQDSAEIQALYRDVLINVTSFFRDPVAFELLDKQVFPKLMGARQRRDPVRIWVLGCSTGEEAYSLAIALSEHAEDHKRPLVAQVFATDLNDYGIETARSGVYPKSIAQEVSPDRLRRWFVETETGYQIVKSIRDMCVFARHNVLNDPPFSRMDLISCRNVLIYMDPVLQRKVVPLLYYALKPSGCLWLGSSETIGTFSDLFQVEDQKHRIYLKASAGFPPSPSAPSTTPRWEATGPAHARAFTPPDRPGADPQREADRVALMRYAPPGVLVDSRLEVLQFRGDTSPFLMPPPGRPSTNLLKMAREGLVVGLRAALQKAIRSDSAVRREGVSVKSNGGFREIDLQIVPVRSGLARELCWLVQFEERAPQSARRSQVLVDGDGQKPTRGRQRPSSSERAEREIARLNEELSSTREYMQTLIEQQEAANEELQSANEEVQSSNEELQSINEELQTSKEEIQSSNEELTTVNEELRNRNEELSETTDNLTNFLASTNIALVKVSRDLKIRSFTPQAERLMRLVPTDVGRPISDIRLPFEVSDLEQSLATAIDSVQPAEREVQDETGRWYALRVRPFRSADNRIEGAVLLLVDIDIQKHAIEVLSEADRRKDEFLAVLAHELRTPLTSLALGFEIVERGGSETPPRERLEAMQRQVSRLMHLVEDLLDVSRIARGMITLRVQELDLAGLVARVCEAMRPQVEKDGRRLSVSVMPEPLPFEGDPARLEQILTNLLSNAAKFTEPEGKISVELALGGDRKAGPEVSLAVKDDGIGMEPDELEHVYELFARAPGSAARDRQGVGVGLHLVKRLVELHGGEISASSEGLGKGSEFVARFPLPRARGTSGQRTGSEATGSGSATEDRRGGRTTAHRRVLVVDDNAEIALTIADIFRMCGLDVQVAHSGPDAIEAAFAFHPTLIILDLGMPGMDGHEVARYLRQRADFDEVAIIALSGYGQQADRERSLRAGCDEHLVKPTSFESLRALIEFQRSPRREATPRVPSSVV